ncbi:MAG: hypothetical protein WAL88_03610 [Nitrosotalea sp.]
MNELGKKLSVSISIAIAFLIAFSFLYIFLKSNTSDLTKQENDFYSQDFGTQKKIVILGSSQTGHLNATYLDGYISKNNKDYRVYNLSITGDRPSQRLGTIDKLISIKPDLVIYGIGFRDFENEEHENMDKSNVTENILPDPQAYVRQLIKLHLLTGYDLNFLQSPKGVTFTFLHDILAPPDTSAAMYVSNTPFFHPHPIGIQITILNSTSDYNQEKQDIQGSFTGMAFPDKNIDAIALKEILTKLREHNIKVVIFTTPYKKSYLEALPNSYKQIFSSILNDITQQHSVKVYPLDDKYENFTGVWTDYNHIALNKKVTIYDYDIGKIILNETQ